MLGRAQVTIHIVSFNLNAFNYRQNCDYYRQYFEISQVFSASFSPIFGLNLELVKIRSSYFIFEFGKSYLILTISSINLDCTFPSLLYYFYFTTLTLEIKQCKVNQIIFEADN